LFEEREGFSGKRPLGNSDWDGDVITELVKQGLITGSIDSDGYIEDADWNAADALLLAAIEEL
jgi:hypothetical protein